ncbi:lysine--tRNA ligase [Patescibacteria group bacterium]|nr:lysine--tRNA ligase [Patescibacteria group bacterium]
MIQEEKDRIQKFIKLQVKGIDPFPSKSSRTHKNKEVFKKFNGLLKEKSIVLAGRLILIRSHGKICFAQIKDDSGKFQICFQQDVLGKEKYKNFLKLIDVGDFIEVKGSLFKTKTGAKTLKVYSWKLLTKTFLPLPEKWHGLSDIEERFRKRYLDLLANDQVMDIFIFRSKLVELIRNFFNKKDFLEVETPILQSMAGGATATPFVTHHNSLDMDMYLRVAPELYLKRLIIGGFEKVYEISKCFRNEGIDWSHNPEFTQIEFYWAYANYNDLMKLVEEFFEFIFKKLFTSNKDLKIKYQGKQINFKPPYKKIKFNKAFIKWAGIDLDKHKSLSALTKQAVRIGIKVDKTWGKDKLIDEIYKEKIRPMIINPCFLIDHPIELSPLAKKTKYSDNYVERFQLVVGKMELCNAFSELNDPADQEQRFKYQQQLRDKGDKEAQQTDNDFILALKHGMPPTAGLGMGIDRLTCLLTDTKNIKEVILFPTMRKKNK